MTAPRPRVEGERLTESVVRTFAMGDVDPLPADCQRLAADWLVLTAEVAAEREKRHAAKMARKAARDEANESTRKWIDAAKEVARLTAEVERLRKALEAEANKSDNDDSPLFTTLAELRAAAGGCHRVTGSVVRELMGLPSKEGDDGTR